MSADTGERISCDVQLISSDGQKRTSTSAQATRLGSIRIA
jgi:hypothetical protein